MFSRQLSAWVGSSLPPAKGTRFSSPSSSRRLVRLQKLASLPRRILKTEIDHYKHRKKQILEASENFERPPEQDVLIPRLTCYEELEWEALEHRVRPGQKVGSRVGAGLDGHPL